MWTARATMAPAASTDVLVKVYETIIVAAEGPTLAGWAVMLLCLPYKVQAISSRKEARPLLGACVGRVEACFCMHLVASSLWCRF